MATNMHVIVIAIAPIGAMIATTIHA